MLKSVIIPLLLGALLLVPASALPARAGNDDLVKVLAGVAALYFIGRTMEARRGTPYEVPLPFGRRQGQIDDPISWTLPEACRTGFATGGLHGRGYDKACLEERVARPARLSPACERWVWTDIGAHTVYDGRCLARDGWIEATRRR